MLADLEYIVYEYFSLGWPVWFTCLPMYSLGCIRRAFLLIWYVPNLVCWLAVGDIVSRSREIDARFNSLFISFHSLEVAVSRFTRRRWADLHFFILCFSDGVDSLFCCPEFNPDLREQMKLWSDF